ncbi:MAG: glycosyltransferase family 4 protein [Anaerolineales bacterium]
MTPQPTLCLPLRWLRQGGSAHFMHQFQAYLQARDWPHITDFEAAPCDIILTNAWSMPYPVLWHYKQHRKAVRLVHRVDGVAQEYGRTDGTDILQADVNRLADATIYQSAYSQAAQRRHHLITADGPVIHNPVDLARFAPRPQYHKPAAPPRLISVSWSSNPHKGLWRIPELARAHPHLEFQVVGPLPKDGDLPPNLTHIDRVPHTDLPDLLRQADIYLSLLENDACPNVILEALASGLPIIYLPSGGVPELVHEAGVALSESAALAQAVSTIMADYPGFARRARATAEGHYAPQDVFARYLAHMLTAQRQPLPQAADHRRAMWHHYSYVLAEQGRKWRRILRGQQTLSGKLRR